MIIYNSTWSILIQCIRVMIFRWQSNLVNAKESVLPVCDKPYHTNKKYYRNGRRLKNCGTMHYVYCTCMTYINLQWHPVRFLLVVPVRGSARGVRYADGKEEGDEDKGGTQVGELVPYGYASIWGLDTHSTHLHINTLNSNDINDIKWLLTLQCLFFVKVYLLVFCQLVLFALK